VEISDRLAGVLMLRAGEMSAAQPVSAETAKRILVTPELVPEG